jgi:uncharacterized protein (TIGR00369 family)
MEVFMITRPEILEGIKRHIQPIRGQENLRLLEIEPGHARLSIEITEESLNLYGNAHGGFLFSLCDIAAGMSTYAYEVANVTQCAGINFVKGVNSGTVYVEATAVHKGRNTAVTRVDITNEKGELLVTGNFTMFLGQKL